MKSKLSLTVVLLMSLIGVLSCTKNNISGNPMVKYTINDTTFEISGILDSDPSNPGYGTQATRAITSGSPVDTLYTINTVAGVGNALILAVNAGDFGVNDYTMPNVFLSISINSNTYEAAPGVTDDLVVTVTSINHGLVDGTFSGTLESGGNKYLSITGEFHDIRFEPHQ
ncbi:MAG TPA: hypothetical protein VG890_07905 [Puia sp.]|nr:hypothetical protein [Puia sp.]